MSNIYETEKLVGEYLLFHYATPEETLPHASGPHEALGFPVRTTELFPEGAPAGRTLDLGCATGRSALELSRTCSEVIGIDFSQAFVDAAEEVRATGERKYTRLEEAHLQTELTARRPEGTHPERVSFEAGDAMNLRADLGSFDRVHAANLICRLPEPTKLLQRLPELVNPGGHLVITTPCTWLGEFTPPDNWPSGSTLGWLQENLSADFELITSTDVPFLIRETARKFQWTVAQGSVWKRK